MQRDGGSGAVAAGEESLASDRVSCGDPAQRLCHLAERHGVHFALHLPLSVGFRLRRLVVQHAVDGGQAGRGMAKVAAFRERGHERQPVVAGGGRGALVLARRSDP